MAEESKVGGAARAAGGLAVAILWCIAVMVTYRYVGISVAARQSRDVEGACAIDGRVARCRCACALPHLTVTCVDVKHRLCAPRLLWVCRLPGLEGCYTALCVLCYCCIASLQPRPRIARISCMSLPHCDGVLLVLQAAGTRRTRRLRK